eukprot:Gregarina_sp_Pseudo_9__2179@NODE_2526_length_968_cov_3_088267_g2320_i0_p3_GENE_NODE_2526_length_968_cov_3_088267_g2320_i0NODE_2526_length_968_cov_3_088267_g2320_i0_p3_ORF_typecomplete_len102_score6_73EFG_C/PF00679_24/0_2_NODE_2526_length_968_cov_3_088267_g2320_i037342
MPHAPPLRTRLLRRRCRTGRRQHAGRTRQRIQLPLALAVSFSTRVRRLPRGSAAEESAGRGKQRLAGRGRRPPLHQPLGFEQQLGQQPFPSAPSMTVINQL